ncbi:hypothetical protein Nepgr_006334 [Nepenthes gracilis]|uniref:Uncharacterized protein n=1 Tax=Nepenthes gracilis TaxID=150966 RepID=A0AAD3S579_NEPGR|nr:hypothetical protein Nepgr_006334 [Nepenthes gracilis]
MVKYSRSRTSYKFVSCHLFSSTTTEETRSICCSSWTIVDFLLQTQDKRKWQEFRPDFSPKSCWMRRQVISIHWLLGGSGAAFKGILLSFCCKVNQSSSKMGTRWMDFPRIERSNRPRGNLLWNLRCRVAVVMRRHSHTLIMITNQESCSIVSI